MRSALRMLSNVDRRGSLSRFLLASNASRNWVLEAPGIPSNLRSARSRLGAPAVRRAAARVAISLRSLADSSTFDFFGGMSPANCRRRQDAFIALLRFGFALLLRTFG